MEPKFFLEPKFFTDPQFFLDQNFFSTFFWTQNFFRYFWDQTFFWTQHILDPFFFGFKNFFGTKNFLEPKTFFWTQKFSWTQKPRIFLDSKIFQIQISLTQKDLVWFYCINLPNQNRLNQRLSKLNTLDLSLVFTITTSLSLLHKNYLTLFTSLELLR